MLVDRKLKSVLNFQYRKTCWHFLTQGYNWLCSIACMAVSHNFSWCSLCLKCPFLSFCPRLSFLTGKIRRELSLLWVILKSDFSQWIRNPGTLWAMGDLTVVVRSIVLVLNNFPLLVLVFERERRNFEWLSTPISNLTVQLNCIEMVFNPLKATVEETFADLNVILSSSSPKS